MYIDIIKFKKNKIADISVYPDLSKTAPKMKIIT